MPTIKIIGLFNGEASEYDGKYLVDYDPTPRIDAQGEFVHLIVTEDRAQARQFRSNTHAVAFYRAVSLKGPRPDGEPNRPLTAYHVEIEDWYRI